MNVFETVKSVLGLLPVVIDAVKAIESAMPQSGAGKEKLELVKNTLQAAYTIGGATLDSFAAVWPALEVMVANVVAVFNKLGIFKRV